MGEIAEIKLQDTVLFLFSIMLTMCMLQAYTDDWPDAQLPIAQYIVSVFLNRVNSATLYATRKSALPDAEKLEGSSRKIVQAYLSQE